MTKNEADGTERKRFGSLDERKKLLETLFSYNKTVIDFCLATVDITLLGG